MTMRTKLMYRILTVFFASLMLALAVTYAHGQEITPAFKVEAVALGASTSADYIATVMDTRCNCGLTEMGFPRGTSQIYGKHPTVVSTLPMFAISAGEAYVSYRFERSHNRVLRIAGHVIMGGESVAHSYAAANDFALQRGAK